MREFLPDRGLPRNSELFYINSDRFLGGDGKVDYPRLFARFIVIDDIENWREAAAGAVVELRRLGQLIDDPNAYQEIESNDDYVAGACIAIDRYCTYNGYESHFSAFLRRSMLLLGTRWPKYSGSLSYPVPSPYQSDDDNQAIKPSNLAKLAYYGNEPKSDRNRNELLKADHYWLGDYGKLRSEFVKYVAEELQQMLDNVDLKLDDVKRISEKVRNEQVSNEPTSE